MRGLSCYPGVAPGREKEMGMDFGFTNDVADLEAVRQWVADAVADGWDIEPTYRVEPVGRAARLTRDGYIAMALMRDNSGETGRRWRYEANVSVWGPDGLAISVPRKYDFALIEKAVRRCGECGKEDVDTQRVGFAGRTCAGCLPEARKKHEYPGWTN
jgi:hypothetical protein